MRHLSVKRDFQLFYCLHVISLLFMSAWPILSHFLPIFDGFSSKLPETANVSFKIVTFCHSQFFSTFLVQILSERGYRFSWEHLKYDVISREFKVHTHANTHVKFGSRIQSGSWQAPLSLHAHDRILTSLLSFLWAKFPQEVYCTIDSWGDTHKRSVCFKSINGLLNH